MAVDLLPVKGRRSFSARWRRRRRFPTRIVALTEAEQGNSELLARMVTTFESAGLTGAGRRILLPVFLVISPEPGALFGTALLLRRRT